MKTEDLHKPEKELCEHKCWRIKENTKMGKIKKIRKSELEEGSESENDENTWSIYSSSIHCKFKPSEDWIKGKEWTDNVCVGTSDEECILCLSDATWEAFFTCRIKLIF